MSFDEAWQVIVECRGWNVGQVSVSLAFEGIRAAEDDVLDAKRAALKLAWEVVKRGTSKQPDRAPGQDGEGPE